MNIPFHAAGALLIAGFGAGGGENDPPEESGSGLIEIKLADEVTVKVFGRVFIDSGWFSGDSPTYFTDSTGTTPELDDGTEFRTARIGVEGTLYEKVGYKAEFDLAGGSGDVDLKDIYMYLKEVLGGEMRGGHFKEPFGLEQLTSSRFITFMERSVMQAFAPDRNTGVQYSDYNASKTMTWAAGVFRTTDDFGTDTGDGEYGYTARLTGTPLYEEEGNDVFHLGAAATFRTDDEVRYRSRPEANLVNRVADTGVIAADDTLVLGGEAAWVGGPFSAQAEYNLASVSATSGSDGDFSGYYAFVSWFVTGDKRTYKNTTGTFDRVKPLENFGAGTGAIEVAVRYSMLDLDDGPSTGELNDITGGVNWYLNPNSRLMFNAVHSEFEDGAVDDSMDALMMRFQFDW